MSHKVPHEAGKSSFDLLDANELFKAADLQAGEKVLDLGCGSGRYSLLAAGIVGPEGAVTGLDLWPEGIEQLKEAAESGGLTNLTAQVADVLGELPIDPGAMDFCLMATVLHDLVERSQEKEGLENAATAIRPGGRLAILEFNKVDGRPGPPKAIRLSPEETRELVEPFGFRLLKTAPLGEYLYLAVFERA